MVVINKIDRPDARPQEVLNEVYDLFIDLDADESVLDFPVLYTNGKLGTATTDPAIPGTDLQPLFEQIITTIPVAKGDPEGAVQILVTNLDYSDYLGRLAIGRVFSGTMRTGQEYSVAKIGWTAHLHQAQDHQKLFQLLLASSAPTSKRPRWSATSSPSPASPASNTIGESFCDVEDPG